MSYNVFSHVNEFNPVACGDSYKYSHFTMLKANVIGLTAYIEPRLVDPNVEIVMFGLQAYIKKYLLTPVQPWMLDEVEADLAMHGEPFDRETWESIINDNGGYLPLKLYAVPEGLPVPSNNILVRVDGYNISEAKFATLTTWIETSLLRAVWYGTTIATNGYSLRKEIQAIYARFGEDPNEAFFAMQDFAGRGVTCNEQAENGGGAHMVNFKGTDTFECLRGLRRWYNQKDVAGFSVWASEHTYEIIFGVDSVGEDAYIDKMLSIVETDPRCKILSIVIDGGDWKRCATKMCTEYRDRIIKIAKMGKKIVFRPDSGDMQETVPFIVNLQCESFGYTENSKGLKRPKYVGCIQGDGVDRSSLINLLGKLISMGFAPTCTIFGSGGALLQKVCRDDFRFAMKVSAALEMINGVAVWNGYQKMTVGKQSKIGYITLAQNVETGKYETIRLDKDGLIGSLPFGYIDVMRLVYDGCSEEKLLIDEHFAQIRERVGHTI